MKAIWNITKKYRKYIMSFLIIAVLIYIIIYLCFFTDGFLSAGKGLAKKDWLSFLGSYLSFIGTLAVSMVAILHNVEYDNKEKHRQRVERVNKIQPIFSVDYVQNVQISNKVEADDLRNGASIKHDNVRFVIENEGNYPILHVKVFDEYVKSILKEREKLIIYVAYDNSADACKKDVIRLFEAKYEKTNANMPKRFNILYEDIDGNSMSQAFELNCFNKKYYYSLVNKKFGDSKEFVIEDIGEKVESN